MTAKDRLTSVCKDGAHDLCSTRICVNPEDGWHNASYKPCACPCHVKQAAVRMMKPDKYRG